MTSPVFGLATAEDADPIEQLLASHGLPTQGLRDCLPHAIVARADGRVVGCAALEVYPSGVLLRSVAVEDAWRGRGLGQELTEQAFVLARSKGATAAYLLTTTAAEFFPRFGFERIERTAVPEDVRRSVEFTSACPSSAIAMRAWLSGHVW